MRLPDMTISHGKGGLAIPFFAFRQLEHVSVPEHGPDAPDGVSSQGRKRTKGEGLGRYTRGYFFRSHLNFRDPENTNVYRG